MNQINPMIISGRMVDAASKGLIAEVEALLKQGADVHYNQDQALRSAAENGHAVMVEFLIAQGGDVHALKNGALLRAVNRNHHEVVRILLENGADANADKGEPLINASQNGKVEIVGHLLKHGANTAASNNLPLAYAAYGGHLDIVKKLVDARCDVFSMRSVAIKLAQLHGKTEVAAFLLAEQEDQRRAFLANLAFTADMKNFATGQYMGMPGSGLVRAAKMDCLDAVLEKFTKAGGILRIADIFDCKDGEDSSAVSVMVEKGAVGKLFALSLWNNDVGAMRAAYERLAKVQKETGKFIQADFDAVVAAYNRDTLKNKSNGKFKL